MLTARSLVRNGSAPLLALAFCLSPAISQADEPRYDDEPSVQVGPRPYYLLDKLSPGPLKKKLERCVDGPFYKTEFSIGHRGGGTLQFPEHTKESHEAGSRMGAGILECDVTFTKDGQLVCRHTSAICTRRPTSCSRRWRRSARRPSRPQNSTRPERV